MTQVEMSWHYQFQEIQIFFSRSWDLQPQILMSGKVQTQIILEVNNQTRVLIQQLESGKQTQQLALVWLMTGFMN